MAFARSRFIPRFSLTQMALAAALALSTQAQGQTVEQPAAATGLPEIKVQGKQNTTGASEGTGSYTAGAARAATGLNLSLRETPQSVSVITRERLDDQNLLTLGDLVGNVTGLSVKEFDSARLGFSARGFEINNFQLDGVPFTWESQWATGESLVDLTIYDRVEVVRGATGLTTGAGDPSAAINLVRKRANSKTLTGTGTVSVGSWDNRRAEVDVSAPLSADGRVRGRLVGSYEDGHSYRDFATVHKTVLYGVIDADLTSTTSLSAGISRQETNPNGTTWGGLPAVYADGSRTEWDRSKTTGTPWTSSDGVNTTYFANLEQRLNSDWKVRLAVDHIENSANSNLLYVSPEYVPPPGVSPIGPDRTTGLGLAGFPAGYDVKRKQNDISVSASGQFALWGRRHETAFGLMHSEQKMNALQRAALSFPAVGDYNNWDGSYPNPGFGPQVPYEHYTTTQSGAYGVVKLRVADPLQLILGGRYSKWERDGAGGPAMFNSTPAYDHRFHDFTPYAGVVFDISEQYSAFASYTDIFKPQDAKDASGNLLDPITGKAKEVGIKGEWLGGRLNGSFSVFRIEQENVAQLVGSFTPPGGITQSIYVPAKGATSHGFDAELAGQILPGWQASLGLSNYKAKQANGADLNPDYPRRTVKFFTKYKLPGVLSNLSIGGGVNWEGASYYLIPAGGKIEQRPFALVNLVAAYQLTPALSTQLNVNNVTDQYYLSQTNFYGINLGAPRSATLSLKYRF